MQNRQKWCYMPRIRFTPSYLPHIIITPGLIPNFGTVSKNGGGGETYITPNAILLPASTARIPRSHSGGECASTPLGRRDGATKEVGSLVYG